MNGNRFVEWILRSPLHGIMSASTMLITLTGRKTGRPIATPVNYYQDGNTLWVLTSRERKWWRNLKGCSDVRLRLRGQEVQAIAEAILEEGAVADQIGEYVQRIPLSAKPLGIRVERGHPEVSDLAKAARERLMVRVDLF